MIEVTQRFYVDSFVQVVIEVGCMAGCESHELKIEKWIDELDEEGTQFNWKFKEGIGMCFSDRVERSLRFLFQYKKWTTYCDSVCMTVEQMRRLHDLLRKVAVPFLDFEDIPKADEMYLVNHGLSFRAVCDKDDPILVVRRHVDEEMYEIGYEYKTHWKFFDRLDRVKDYVFSNQMRYCLNLNDCMMSEQDMDILLKQIDADLKTIEKKGVGESC